MKVKDLYDTLKGPVSIWSMDAVENIAEAHCMSELYKNKEILEAEVVRMYPFNLRGNDPKTIIEIR